MKIVFDRNELELTATEDDKLVHLCEAWGTVVPIHAFPWNMQANIKAKAGIEVFCINAAAF